MLSSCPARLPLSLNVVILLSHLGQNDVIAVMETSNALVLSAFIWTVELLVVVVVVVIVGVVGTSTLTGRQNNSMMVTTAINKRYIGLRATVLLSVSSVFRIVCQIMLILVPFYRASAVAASPVLATIGMSVRPSVCPSVTRWH